MFVMSSGEGINGDAQDWRCLRVVEGVIASSYLRQTSFLYVRLSLEKEVLHTSCFSLQLFVAEAVVHRIEARVSYLPLDDDLVGCVLTKLCLRSGHETWILFQRCSEEKVELVSLWKGRHYWNIRAF